MLRFLFSFCGTEADAAQVDHKDEEMIMGAFGMVRNPANKSGPLGDNLNLAQAAFTVVPYRVV